MTEYDAILVDLQLVPTPDFMQSGMASLLKCLRLERKMYTQIGNWLVCKQSWASGTATARDTRRFSLSRATPPTPGASR